MRYLFLLLLALAISCSQTETKTENIRVSIQEGGYDIYSTDGYLLLELTKRNCDSLSLATLKYIYEVAEEYYNSPESFKDKPVKERKQKNISASLAKYNQNN